MGKINGVRVTEERIEDWAEEAEQGYDVERLRERGRRPADDGAARSSRPGWGWM